ncbi:hypothetical protein FYJ28_13050 [Arthrobacter sp. BL-252-APC-1A]|uniref:hypothetical protein n=1 Tax=Arthrobacter sp. BL-252-APC-1A TaxID=2606622 RepID=UPI00130F7515|nr:hypothetical protein [Arthrobacter sp. BL-252-APC-1A]MSR99741.1 hypothetical protein [Arthrobacter sp. BL-252-APC-1A]
MTQAQSLRLADPQVTADLRNFVSRARSADDGAVRLQAVGEVLAAYVCVLRPRVLGEAMPTVIGMRAMPLGVPAELDTTVQLSAVADRLARLDSGDTELPVPPMTVSESWAGIAAPRAGWQHEAEVEVSLLEQAAHRGIKDVAARIPGNPGAAMVNNVRVPIWSEPIAGLAAELPAGAAFAALTLGFLPKSGTASLFSNGRWLRLSTSTGHVLVRPPSVLF